MSNRVSILVLLILLAAPALGEDRATVRVANLIYAGSKSARCFSHEFLNLARRDAKLETEGEFRRVRLDDAELFEFPFAVISGEGAFEFSPEERAQLKKYVESGGFLLVSAGCSSPSWDVSFRKELERVFPKRELKDIQPDHALFRSVYEIDALRGKRISSRPKLEGLTLDDRLALVYSADGLNDPDTAGKGCCCCGGNEILNARQVNVNILVYAMTH